MENQIESIGNIPFSERRKEWMKKYQKTYMKEYYKNKMIECECGCIIFPHAVKKHKETMKHKYKLMVKTS